MFIKDGRIILDASMEAVGDRYAEVMVAPDKAEAARALKPLSERQIFGKSVFLFDGVDRGIWPRSANCTSQASPICSSP
jgi:ABC-2 type transport system ATP-binding protein